jgi:hypothetical protein
LHIIIVCTVHRSVDPSAFQYLRPVVRSFKSPDSERARQKKKKIGKTNKK